MRRTNILDNVEGLLKYTTNKKKESLTFGVNGQYQTQHLTLKAQRFEGFDFSKIQIRLELLYPITIKSCQLSTSFKLLSDDQIFCKGYQSWSESGLYYKKDRMKLMQPLAKPLFGQMGDNFFLQKQIKNHQLRSWNYTYIQQAKEVVLFCGSCDEQTAFTLFLYQTRKNQITIAKDVEGLVLKKGNSILLFDLFFFDGFKQEAFKQYFDFSETNRKKIQKKTGYTSWYNRFNKIDASYLKQQLTAFEKHNIPIDYFQIDDGWQKSIGDWLDTKPGFGGEMNNLSGEISEAGFSAGLWVAPFICEKNSFIFKQKKHWILKNTKGQLVKAGYHPLWSGWFYALDFYNEEVRAYLTKVFTTIFEIWEFKLVKLDFLYAVCLSPPLHKTRSAVMYEAMRWLNKICGENEILGCGVPLTAAQDRVTYCRIGADVHTSWRHLLRLVRAGERPSTINALKNTLTLYELDAHYFYNDADVCLLRSENNQLSQAEKITQLYVNYIFGSLFFISDEIENYDTKTMQLYRSCFPIKAATDIHLEMVDELYVSRFKINICKYILYSNLTDQARQIQLPEGVFFNCMEKAIVQNKNINLEAHASLCLLKLPKADISLVNDVLHLLPEMKQIV